LNAYESTPFNLTVQILWNFVPMWTKLNHPSVATFLGVDTKIFPLALVYGWGGNNNIVCYLASHPAAPRLILV